MSYSTLATASVSLALLGIALAVVAAILHCVRRRQWADRTLTLMLVLLAGAAASSFLAGAEGDHDLQQRAHRVLSLAASAERAASTRAGRYTTSITRLRRLSPALAAELRVDGAMVNIYTNAVTDSVRLRVWLGFGNPVQLTLRARGRLHRGPGARVTRVAGRRAATPHPADNSPV
jgi:hypothetical protein